MASSFRSTCSSMGHKKSTWGSGIHTSYPQMATSSPRPWPGATSCSSSGSSRRRRQPLRSLARADLRRLCRLAVHGHRGGTVRGQLLSHVIENEVPPPPSEEVAAFVVFPFLVVMLTWVSVRPDPEMASPLAEALE